MNENCINGIDVRAFPTPWRAGVEVVLRDMSHGKKLSVATKIEFQEIDPGTLIKPTCTINMNAAQQLMDDLWACGIRPAEGTGSAGALAATQAHLNDMRDIAMRMVNRLIGNGANATCTK